METILALKSGRLDRHVRRTHLRMAEESSRYRLAYWLEEAMRLAHLPGENEGRIYCFRRVSFSGIPAEADRQIWVDAVQHVLAAVAAHAVHGSNPGANASNAIFFHNREEALEALLRHALRGRSGAGPARPAWYSASLLGVAEETSYEQQIPPLLDQLRALSVASASAGLLFAALDDIDPACLLSAIPAETAREWIRELEEGQDSASAAAPVPLPTKLETVLRRASAEFGWKDPRTVWLATEAVLCVASNTRMPGSAIRRARSTLRSLEAKQCGGPKERFLFNAGENKLKALVFDDERDAGAKLPSEAQPKLASVVESLGRTDEAGHALVNGLAARAKRLNEIRTLDSLPAAAKTAPSEILPTDKAGAPMLGEITSCAGLFFLLNAVRRLGIVRAVHGSPALAEADFASHILKQLSICAGVADDDPILRCLPAPEARLVLDPLALAELQRKPEYFPAGYAPSPHQDFDSDRLLRIWVLAVRRWCWRMGRLSLREIVHRRGRVWLTRTDLDITLPLREADIRIRRIGLDIDPGWLPWFGGYGRVVRFHYRDQEPGAETC
jgi:hypothetical protein